MLSAAVVLGYCSTSIPCAPLCRASTGFTEFQVDSMCVQLGHHTCTLCLLLATFSFARSTHWLRFVPIRLVCVVVSAAAATAAAPSTRSPSAAGHSCATTRLRATASLKPRTATATARVLTCPAAARSALRRVCLPCAPSLSSVGVVALLAGALFRLLLLLVGFPSPRSTWLLLTVLRSGARLQAFLEASARNRLKPLHGPQNVHPTPRLCPYIAFLYNETTGMP